MYTYVILFVCYSLDRPARSEKSSVIFTVSLRKTRTPKTHACGAVTVRGSETLPTFSSSMLRFFSRGSQEYRFADGAAFVRYAVSLANTPPTRPSGRRGSLSPWKERNENVSEQVSQRSIVISINGRSSRDRLLSPLTPLETSLPLSLCVTIIISPPPISPPDLTGAARHSINNATTTHLMSPNIRVVRRLSSSYPSLTISAWSSSKISTWLRRGGTPK